MLIFVLYNKYLLHFSHYKKLIVTITLMNNTIKLYNLQFNSVKTYVFTLAFVVGNLLLPQLAHLIPNGGPTLLPIYFFTLIAAYKYGIRAGLLTAILSPIINSLLFGIPAIQVLPVILIKSTLLATFAAVLAQRTGKINIMILSVVVLSYQIIGSFFEWLLSTSFTLALQDFRIGFPGMILQILGGFIVLKLLAKR